MRKLLFKDTIFEDIFYIGKRKVFSLQNNNFFKFNSYSHYKNSCEIIEEYNFLLPIPIKFKIFYEVKHVSLFTRVLEQKSIMVGSRKYPKVWNVIKNNKLLLKNYLLFMGMNVSFLNSGDLIKRQDIITNQNYGSVMMSCSLYNNKTKEFEYYGLEIYDTLDTKVNVENSAFEILKNCENLLKKFLLKLNNTPTNSPNKCQTCTIDYSLCNQVDFIMKSLYTALNDCELLQDQLTDSEKEILDKIQDELKILNSNQEAEEIQKKL